MLRLDQRPLYSRAAEQIEMMIQNERLSPGDRLLSEASFAARLGVSRSTIREALRELELRGRIQKSHGRATVVSDPPPILTGLTALESLESLAARQGWHCGTHSIHIETVSLPTGLETFFGLAPGVPTTYLRRIKTRDGSPICLMESWVPAALISEEVMRARFTRSIAEMLLASDDPHLDYAIAEVGAVAADASTAHALGIKPKTPLVVLTERLFQNPTKPICFSQNAFIPASIQLEVMRRPNAP